MSAKVYLPEMNRDEVKEAVAAGAVLLVPVATIEQHGPHAPLHTDIDNVTAILLEVAQEVTPDPVTLVSAPVWFSNSPFDVERYPGGIHIRDEVFKAALNDILESYLRGGFKKIALVNGHGGGTEWVVPEVVRKLNRKESSLWPEWRIPAEAQVVTFEYFALLEVFAGEELEALRSNPPGSDWHAGDLETALQLFLHPELVDLSKARPGHRYRPLKFAPHDLGRNWFWQYILCGYPPAAGERGEVEAVSGDPTLASAELGEKTFRLAVKTLAEFVREFAQR